MTFLPLAYENLNFSGAVGISVLGFGIVLAVLAVLAVFVILLSKIINAGKKDKTVAPTEKVAEPIPSQADVAPAITAPKEDAQNEPEIPHIPGYVVLDGVSEQDAAVVMAITSHQTGIDLSRLDFKSIKRLNQSPVLENIEEQDAAAIMAITSDKTGIPLENLIFNSIKLVED